MDDSSWKVKCSSATLQQHLMAHPSSTLRRKKLEISWRLAQVSIFILMLDMMNLPNPKQFSASSRVPTEDTGSLFSAFGSRVPLMSSRMPSEKLSYQNQRNGANPFVSSSVHLFPILRCNIVFKVQTLLCIVQMWLRQSFHHKVSDNEKVEWRSTNPANAVKLPDTNGQMPGKLASQAELSVSKNSSALSHQYPRHSGLWNVNPGIAVHMENGETIAQWRKLYFQKFGIRVPEDQSGWDWPEGLPLTASLVQSSAPLPLSKHPDCNHLVGSSEEGDGNAGDEHGDEHGAVLELEENRSENADEGDEGDDGIADAGDDAGILIPGGRGRDDAGRDDAGIKIPGYLTAMTLN
ncbi:Histone-lysine N-methyltransferase ATX [Salix suchowensis]|nr:Histone-lysine N-methyltransferase ATX [Salix suchowensis]